MSQNEKNEWKLPENTGKPLSTVLNITRHWDALSSESQYLEVNQYDLASTIFILGHRVLAQLPEEQFTLRDKTGFELPFHFMDKKFKPKIPGYISEDEQKDLNWILPYSMKEQYMETCKRYNISLDDLGMRIFNMGLNVVQSMREEDASIQFYHEGRKRTYAFSVPKPVERLKKYYLQQDKPQGLLGGGD